MRWTSGADGIGPDYCKDCRKVRQASTECDKCPRPDILPENDTAIDWYRRCDTQWRVGGMGSPIGLDYGGAKLAAELAGIRITPDDFSKLQVLETETLNVMRERHGKDED